MNSGSLDLHGIKDKIASCGVDLHSWGSTRTHPDIERIKVLQKKVETINMGELTKGNRLDFLLASKELDSLLLKQEIYWAQRSHISWMKHGDKNTKFFHSKASQRRRRNFIQGIRDKDNNWVEVTDAIAGVAVSYF